MSLYVCLFVCSRRVCSPACWLRWQHRPKVVFQLTVEENEDLSATMLQLYCCRGDTEAPVHQQHCATLWQLATMLLSYLLLGDVHNSAVWRYEQIKKSVKYQWKRKIDDRFTWKLNKDNKRNVSVNKSFHKVPESVENILNVQPQSVHTAVRSKTTTPLTNIHDVIHNQMWIQWFRDMRGEDAEWVWWVWPA